MKKLDFWRSDWFLGVVVTLVLLAFSGGDLIQSLERKAYDLGVRSASRTPSDKVAVIAIDKQSIDNIGRWPWPRDVHATLTDKLTAAKAKVIANTAFFYQMVCGQLPFQGDSMAQLMFKIANEPHADIRTHNPNLPACVAAIVNKSLVKEPEQRYQDGELMAKALRLCLQSLSPAARQAEATAAPPAPAASASGS